MLYLLLILFSRGAGEQSISGSSFSATPGTHCPAGTSFRHGKAHIDVEECALICLQYDDCPYFHWDYPGNTNAPCFLRNACNFVSHSTSITYTRLDTPTNWLTVPDISNMPGMLTFTSKYFDGNNYGLMNNMDANVCAFHCLITDCAATVYGSSRTCVFNSQSGVGSLNSNTAYTVYVRAVTMGCVPGYSCYALLSFEDGQTKTTAKDQCGNAGGHLVEFNSQDELNAMKADGRFDVFTAPLWMGIHYTAGQWQGENSHSAISILPWLAGQPTSASEGTSVTVDPVNSWGFATASDISTAFPLCEYSALTMTTRGQQMNELNDGSLTTCFTPQSPSEAAGTTLKTLHLSAAVVSQIMVKVHGDGIVCSQNVRIWQMITGNDTRSGAVFFPCQLTASYVWQQKQLCLFSCQCVDTDACSAAYLRLNYTSGISICEFRVM